MTVEIIFFVGLFLIAIVVFILLVKNKRKKGQKTDDLPGDPTEAIFQRLDDL